MYGGDGNDFDQSPQNEAAAADVAVAEGGAMTTRALLVPLEARPGKEAEVEEFLRSALPLVEQEPGTTAWFAIRFGPSRFGIFDAFPDDDARQAHLSGAVAAALMEKADDLFAEPPDIQQLDVLTDKLPG